MEAGLRFFLLEAYLRELVLFEPILTEFALRIVDLFEYFFAATLTELAFPDEIVSVLKQLWN